MNNGKRASFFLDRTSALRLCAAADFAFYRGSPLTHFITIHLDEANVASNSSKFRSLFLSLVGDWLSFHGFPLCYVWVFENPPGGGNHLHLLLHVPEDVRSKFRPRLSAWLRLSGATWPKHVRFSKIINMKKIGRGSIHDERIHYVNGLTGVVMYILKGLDEQTCDELNVRHKFQGEVIGKRCGFSETLGPQARRSLSGIRIANPKVGFVAQSWAPRALVIAHAFARYPSNI